MSTEAGSAPITSSSPAAPASAVRPAARFWWQACAFVFVVGAAGYGWKGSPSAIFGAQGAKPSLEASFGGPPASGAKAQAQEATASTEGDNFAGSGVSREQVLAMATKLEERLKQEPKEANGWALLGRTRMALGQMEQSVAAYRQATTLAPQDASLWADYADAVGTQNGRKLAGEPEKLIARALQADPNHLKALALAGTVAFQRGDMATALQHWERAVKVGPPEHPLVRMLEGAVADAKAQSRGLTSGKPANAQTSAAAPATATATDAAAKAIRGRVSLDAALKDKVQPEDTVFVFARPAPGGMPLAILRKQAKDLPFDFTLDDSLAMSPAARISGAAQVVVTARVSRSGQAMPQPGDLEGQAAAVAPGSQGVAIDISKVRAAP